jgi:phospholipid/cholesterol/gamma-HCH transport system substrate-binding protein
VNPVIAAIAAVALVAALVVILLPHAGRKYVVAEFPRTVSLYEGSDVRILGIPVGTVDTVTPSGTKVLVKFHYDDKYKVPADAKAAIISPSIVGDRFIQLTPAYKSGPVLEDNAHLGEDRTATPLELDEIFGALDTLDQALGPEGANKPGANGVGALTRLLDSTARNFGGQGVQFNQTLHDLGRLTQTLADNKDELFGTAAEVEKFVNTLAKNDTTVRRFADSLASGSQMLAADRQELGAALRNLSVAMVEVRGFVHENRAALGSNIKGLTRISNTVVKRRAQIDEILHVAPLALNNLALAYNPITGTLDTRDSVGELGDKLKSNPGTVLCSFINEATGTSGCSNLQKSLGVKRTAPFAAKRGASQTVDTSLAGLVRAER